MDSARVLVTGGAGFIGSNFIRHLLRTHPGWTVVNLDKLTYAGNPENVQDLDGKPGYQFIRADIADRAAVAEVFRANPFDVVVNFAAETHVDRSILDPAPFVETNVKGTQILLEAARSSSVKRFVQISTDEVYGSTITGSFTEDSPVKPNSPYAASKAGADLLCQSYHRTYGLPVIITRSSNNYGPHQFPEKLIPLMILNILQGKPLPVYGTGENVRDWIYVGDNCRAIAEVVKRGRIGQVYNVGSGQECRNIDLVRLLCRIMAPRVGRAAAELEASITFVKDRPGHDWRYALDTSKVRNELGFRPEVSLANGLERTVDWYLTNRSWLQKASARG